MNDSNSGRKDGIQGFGYGYGYGRRCQLKIHNLKIPPKQKPSSLNPKPLKHKQQIHQHEKNAKNQRLNLINKTIQLICNDNGHDHPHLHHRPGTTCTSYSLNWRREFQMKEENFCRRRGRNKGNLDGRHNSRNLSSYHPSKEQKSNHFDLLDDNLKSINPTSQQLCQSLTSTHYNRLPPSPPLSNLSPQYMSIQLSRSPPPQHYAHPPVPLGSSGNNYLRFGQRNMKITSYSQRNRRGSQRYERYGGYFSGNGNRSGKTNEKVNPNINMGMGMGMGGIGKWQVDKRNTQGLQSFI